MKDASENGHGRSSVSRVARCVREALEHQEVPLAAVCERLGLEYNLEWGMRPKRLCIFVSKYDHVLWEILLRHKAGACPRRQSGSRSAASRPA